MVDRAIRETLTLTSGINTAGRRYQALGALLIALATVIGALASHALKSRLTVDRYAVLQTAVQYQFFHALGLIALGFMLDRYRTRALLWGARLCVAGIVLFSGSLYALIAGSPTFIGVATPAGGLCLIGGWLLTAWALLRVPQQS